MNYSKAMAVVVAYDIYIECCEGKLNPAWYVKDPLPFWSFREKLPMQQLSYDPCKRVYPGDCHMRVTTQQGRSRHDTVRTIGTVPEDPLA